MSITQARATVVREPSSQAFVEATANPPFLYELSPAEARAMLDDVQTAPIDKPPVEPAQGGGQARAQRRLGTRRGTCPEASAHAPSETRDMNTTEPLRSPAPARAITPWSDASRRAPLTPTESPTFGDIVEDVLPVIGVVDVAGPPVIFVAGPWLLLGLMLTGPFALLVTFVVVGLVAAALLLTLAAIFAAPYVLVRRLYRRYRASQAISVLAPQVASPHPRRVAA